MRGMTPLTSVTRLQRGRWAIIPRIEVLIAPGVLRLVPLMIARVAMKHADGNVTQAARALGIHRQTLQRILKRGRS